MNEFKSIDKRKIGILAVLYLILICLAIYSFSMSIDKNSSSTFWYYMFLLLISIFGCIFISKYFYQEYTFYRIEKFCNTLVEFQSENFHLEIQTFDELILIVNNFNAIWKKYLEIKKIEKRERFSGECIYYTKLFIKIQTEVSVKIFTFSKQFVSENKIPIKRKGILLNKLPNYIIYASFGHEIDKFPIFTEILIKLVDSTNIDTELKLIMLEKIFCKAISKNDEIEWIIMNFLNGLMNRLYLNSKIPLEDKQQQLYHYRNSFPYLFKYSKVKINLEIQLHQKIDIIKKTINELSQDFRHAHILELAQETGINADDLRYFIEKIAKHKYMDIKYIKKHDRVIFQSEIEDQIDDLVHKFEEWDGVAQKKV